MASSIDWNDSDPSQAWSEAARGSLTHILETMDQVLVASSGRPLMSTLSRGGIDKLSSQLTLFINYGSIHRDQTCQQECAASFLNGALELRLPNKLSDIQKWITKRILEASIHPALAALLKSKRSLERNYEKHAFMRQGSVTRRLLKAAKQLDELDVHGLAQVAIDVNSGAPDSPEGEPEWETVMSESQEVDPMTTSCPGLTDAAFNKFLLQRSWSQQASSNSAIKKQASNPDEIATVGVSEKGTKQNEGAAVAGAKKKLTHRRTVSDTSELKHFQFVQKYPAAAHAETGRLLTKLSEEESPDQEPKPSSHRHRRSWSQTVPPSVTGCWTANPRPASAATRLPKSRNQSLVNYIVSGDFSKHQLAPLDQDNAHILLAEAMIQYGNRLNFKSTKSPPKEGDKERSTDMDQVQSRLQDLATYDRHVSSESLDNSSTHELNDDTADGVTSRTVPNPKILNKSRSAEATALRLLMSMSDPHGYKARDLQLLAADATVPESPGEGETVSSTPDDLEQTENLSEDDESIVELQRGSEAWAPPRPQLIMHINKKKKLKVAMKEQGLMCHDCGMQVQAEYFKYFRYCHYFGKYSCTTCHTNKSHILPAKVVYKWDFDEYKVSDFAHTVLDRMSTDPLFDMATLNAKLVGKVGRLRKCLEMRARGVGMAKYLANCRLAHTACQEMEEVLSIEDPKVLSLQDLKRIGLSSYDRDLGAMLDAGQAHVAGCFLCQSRGFFCDVCISGRKGGGDASPVAIFPFQLDVVQCTECYACYHAKCYASIGKNFCSKCDRIRIREEAKKFVKTDSPVDNDM